MGQFAAISGNCYKTPYTMIAPIICLTCSRSISLVAGLSLAAAGVLPVSGPDHADLAEAPFMIDLVDHAPGQSEPLVSL